MMIWAGDGAGGGYSAQLHEVLHWATPKQQQQQNVWAHRPASASLSSRYKGSATTDAHAQPAQCAYAEAVLAGLPEDDEAVQLARLAEASGNSLESVLQFQHKALSGKEAEANAAQDSDPYQDVRSWCPPEEWDAYIADRQKRKDLPPRDWKKLKRHRQDVKAKQAAMSMEWLRK
ncbi:g3442 [Coccomyxa viridis]|uniref:G3442 protein n=1 Tax=Coccomyxa viridis TaxID=1274662 RepID=A0ABP1FRT2_9CHLO